MEKETKTDEKTLEELLKDPVYVNYNLLLKLEEIKRILLFIHEMKVRDAEQREVKKEQREGVVK